MDLIMSSPNTRLLLSTKIYSIPVELKPSGLLCPVPGKKAPAISADGIVPGRVLLKQSSRLKGAVPAFSTESIRHRRVIEMARRGEPRFALSLCPAIPS